jgi:hypothetical protein
VIAAATNLFAVLSGRSDANGLDHPRLEVFIGVIVGAIYLGGGGPPPTFGPANLWAYSVGVNFPDGYRVVHGLKPVMDRWPITQNVVPIANNTMVMVGSINGVLQLMARELPHLVECAAP